MLDLIIYLPVILHLIVVVALIDAYLSRCLRKGYLLLLYLLYGAAAVYAVNRLPPIVWTFFANPFTPILPLLIPLRFYVDMSTNPWKYKRSLEELSESMLGLARLYYHVRRDFWSTTLFFTLPVAAAVFSATAIMTLGTLRGLCEFGTITMCPDWITLITPEMIGSMVIMIAIIDFAAGILAIKIIDRVYSQL